MGAAAPALISRPRPEAVWRPLTSTPMAAADVGQVIELLRAAPQTAYCEWEDAALLRGHLSHSADLCRVVRDGSGRVVAALIAGSFGVRGSISHAVVAPGHRRSGLARVMATDALAAFRRRGVRRVALAVLDGNPAAAALWTRAGFSPVHGERTYECDL
ncbi:GNAT family N-acetyltransferase [Streptomyces actinomycinicus]|uniref:GNAT family N-acetyltransferase n=1 Tax=Streptomyces actinomycinicus TaxID=1695166 RepID=A0A937EIE9_9ACTN|nr:GNAT family N-acetyltransferase [Streptomyces actinomycinicus]MBL1083662.1 GNAT family N-acetyltransferase [Streptomyces actinomycinicus]